MFRARRSSRLTAAGLLLVLAGLASNSRLSSFLLSSNHHFDNALSRGTILIVQVLLLAAGATILVLRNDPARLRRFMINAAVTSGSILLSFAGVELFLRIHPAGTPYVLRLFAEHPSGRLKLKPNLNVATRVGTTMIPITTNSCGMRWREVSPANPSTRRRIAFVGDSFTFGEWAEDLPHAFASVFESLVDARSYEVLNFGVPSYGLAEVKQQILEDVLPFRPEFLFLMFFNGNDFVDTYLGAERYQVVDGIAILDSLNYERRIPAAFRQPAYVDRGNRLARRVLDGSRVFQILEQIQWLYASASRQREVAPSESFTKFTSWCGTRPTALAVAAIDSTLRVLDEVWTCCRSNGITLVVATIPFAEQVYASRPEGDGYSVFLPQRYILDFSREHDIPHLDLLPALRLYAQQTEARLYVVGDPHFSTTGHRVTGMALAAFFHSLPAAR